MSWQSRHPDHLITNPQSVANGALTPQIPSENMPLVSKCSRSVTTRQGASRTRHHRIRAAPVARFMPRPGGCRCDLTARDPEFRVGVGRPTHHDSRRSAMRPIPTVPGQVRSRRVASLGLATLLAIATVAASVTRTLHRGASRRCDGQGRGNGARPDRAVRRNHILGGAEGEGGLVPGPRSRTATSAASSSTTS